MYSFSVYFTKPFRKEESKRFEEDRNEMFDAETRAKAFGIWKAIETGKPVEIIKTGDICEYTITPTMEGVWIRNFHGEDQWIKMS